MDFEVYPRGIRIKNRSQSTDSKGGTRGKVSDFSKASRSRLSWVYANGPWVSMLTLTYHHRVSGDNICPIDGSESKEHLRQFCQSLKRRGIKFLWVLEFQRRGSPHYHVWMDHRFDDCPTWDDNNGNSWRPLMQSWLRISGQQWDSSAVAFAMHQKTYVDWKVLAGVNYASKYATKSVQKELPVGVESFGRWWGVSRDAVVPEMTFSVDTSHNNPEAKTEFARMNRQIQKAIEHWSGRPIKHRSAWNGGAYVLREERRDSILRIFDQYLNYFQGQKMADRERYNDIAYFGRKLDERQAIRRDPKNIGYDLDSMVHLYQKYELRFIPTPVGDVYGVRSIVSAARLQLDRSSKTDSDWSTFFHKMRQLIKNQHLTTNFPTYFQN